MAAPSKFLIKCPKCRTSCYEFRKGLPCVGGHKHVTNDQRRLTRKLGL